MIITKRVGEKYHNIITYPYDEHGNVVKKFMLNGGIRRLQRHGLKVDGGDGKVDNLHIYYDGTQPSIDLHIHNRD